MTVNTSFGLQYASSTELLAAISCALAPAVFRFPFRLLAGTVGLLRDWRRTTRQRESRRAGEVSVKSVDIPTTCELRTFYLHSRSESDEHTYAVHGSMSTRKPRKVDCNSEDYILYGYMYMKSKRSSQQSRHPAPCPSFFDAPLGLAPTGYIVAAAAPAFLAEGATGLAEASVLAEETAGFRVGGLLAVDGLNLAEAAAGVGLVRDEGEVLGRTGRVR